MVTVTDARFGTVKASPRFALLSFVLFLNGCASACACLPPTPSWSPSGVAPELRCSFEPKPGDFDEFVQFQDYVLEDQTGLAESCDVFDGGGPDPEGDLRATPDADGILEFWWIDGVCTDRILRLTSSGGEFDLEVSDVWRPQPGDPTPGPCPAIGISRSARVQLNH